MSKEILDVINAVVYYGRYITSHNYIVPKDDFDHFAEMERYYLSLPLPEGMSKNRADFMRILQIGWFSGKELERLNNTNYSDLRYIPWKPTEYVASVDEVIGKATERSEAAQVGGNNKSKDVCVIEQ